MAKTIIRQHPALFLGELREDLERVWVEDSKTHKHYDFRVVSTGDIVSETLIAYPNEEEFEIV